MRDPQEAAAARALELLGGVEPPSPETDEAAQEEGQVDETLARVSSGPESAAEEPQQEAEVVEEEPEFQVPNLDPKLPEDLAEELAMDWEDEPEDDEAPSEDVEEEYEDDDPRVEQLRAELRKAQRKAEWAEKQRMEAKREKWVAEAKKYFPLSEPSLVNIKATSRRGFMREAQAAHKALQPFVSEIFAGYQKTIDAAKAKAVEETKAELASAWGKPTVQPSAHEATTELARRERLSGSRDLTERIKARLYPDG